ncbi:Cytochrome c1, heme protein, mitochondrial [Wickerhamomyces ciferrii]|uniref:quinol--cytochrome-c reductase n=1 Tax=Wickerhamomyces ciferrii (strain ATCC 14091 / BCRC 22168 / CBS 111 / JCM 3599 / NBRC 0793 / NRRL Y-1031 F-60-10) TaxID=1206466 RepID=K0KPF7_WICCF|nr:Cytochrome c1, heme protein, mitochondrial [Wickerhamomyces ciferrii]CCH43028.1 Cytochrome c1, heme protein, mitochondrial [Wickerhamomyces ciferrii]
MFSSIRSTVRNNIKQFSTSAKKAAVEPNSLTKKVIAGGVAASGLTASYLLYEDSVTADAMTAAEHGLHPPAYGWSHNGMIDTFDHASIRRGYQVYREVCAACHSLERVAWRTLVGVSHSNAEVRAMAEEFEYDDEPDDQGNPRKRPGKLADYIPGPYANEQAARAANQGALPPDLSLIVKARHGACDYIFALLTGYPDEPPAGVVLPPGSNYNPYFPGGSIAMGRVLFDDLVEFEDGTPATTSQMAKDVTTFLNWAAEPEHDERKRLGLKAVIVLSALYLISVYVKKFKWAPIKTRKIRFTPPKN